MKGKERRIEKEEKEKLVEKHRAEKDKRWIVIKMDCYMIFRQKWKYYSTLV